MNRRSEGFIGVLVVIIMVLTLAAAVFTFANNIGKKQRNNSPDATAAQARLVGFSLSPKDNQPSNFTDFFTRLPKKNAAVSWYGDWQEISKSRGGANATAGLAKQYNYVPIIDVNAHKGGGNVSQMVPLRAITPPQARQYADAAAAFCKKHFLAYFGIGTEVNRIYTTDLADFDTFVSLFNQTADAVHSSCPETKVFTTFQLEYLRGLRGGLYGGINDEGANDWQLLSRFDKADILAFSTYPGIVYKDPADIPAGYYNSILSYTAKPVAFSEVGWPSKIGAAGWESSQDEQARFVGRFVELAKSSKPVFSIWSFLYDQNLPAPFGGIGLLNPDGSPRPGYQTWINQ